MATARLAAVPVLVPVLAASACGSGQERESSPPLRVSGSETASATASTTADLAAEALAVVRRYPAALEAAVEARSADPLLPVTTRAWAEELMANYRRNFFAKGRTFIGRSRIASAEPSVQGDRVVVDSCVDASNVFAVPEGTTEVRPGTGAVSAGRIQNTFVLSRADGAWKISDIESEGAQC